ncbi:MAG: MarC family protein [Candidatus Hadarchaeales archaeon]
MEMLAEILKCFVSLFVIMGPFASIPVFISVTKTMKEKSISAAAFQAIAIAALLLYIFLFLGPLILLAFGISFDSLRVAGGIVLSILGVELVLGISLAGKRYRYSPPIVLIGTPLLTGPGVIVTTMLFVKMYGFLITGIGAAGALFLSWLILWLSHHISKILGRYGVEILSRITGILLVAVAVEFAVEGLKAMV